MYQIKLHNPKTIAKRFLVLSNLKDWKKGELSVEHYENYILVVGEKPLKKSEEKDEKRQVSVYLSDDLVQVHEGRLVSHNLSSRCDLFLKSDQYLMDDDDNRFVVCYRDEVKLHLDHLPKGMVNDWIEKFGDQFPLPSDDEVFSRTNQAVLLPLVKMKKAKIFL